MSTSTPALPALAGTPAATLSTCPSTPAPSRFTDAERDALVREHLGLVHHVARTLTRRLPHAPPLEELVSTGTVGLLHALEAFDGTRGIAFSTFATPRIRGAILDELRRDDEAPRSVRRRRRELTTARDALTAAAGRAPTDTELAAHLGIDVTTLWSWQRQVASAQAVRLDAPRAGSEGTTEVGAVLDRLVAHADAPDAVLLREERGRVLRGAILALKAQQRVVLAMYYFEELPLSEIAPVLGVSESRISQIHKQALGQLRTALREPLGLAA